MKSRLLRPVFAAIAAVSVVIAVAIPLSTPASASNDPIVVCQETADGTKASYQFPADCETVVTTLLPTGYDTLILNLRLKCESTASYAVGLRLNFNGDYGNNYDSYVQDESGGGGTTSDRFATHITVGDLTCSKSPNPDDVDTGYELIIPFASSTVFHKQVIGHSATTSYTTIGGLNAVTEWDGLAAGSWHRASIGAVNRIDLTNSAGAQFTFGSTFDIYAQ